MFVLEGRCWFLTGRGAELQSGFLGGVLDSLLAGDFAFMAVYLPKCCT